MRSEELAEIRDRLDETSFEKAYIKGDKWKGYEVKSEGNGVVIAEVSCGTDAEFIAHAREDVPKLLAEIERLKKVAHEILEDYDRAERRVIDEVSTNRRFALDVQERVIKSYQNEINGVEDDD